MDIEYRAYSRKADTYAYIREMLEKILAETDDQAAGLANASSLLMLQLEELNWAGFYLMKDGGQTETDEPTSSFDVPDFLK